MKLRRQRGVTLLEMIVVITILLILMGAAVPVLKVSVRRQREVDLRRDLWEMRSAIDRYKDAADKNAFQIKLGSEGYPRLRIGIGPLPAESLARDFVLARFAPQELDSLSELLPDLADAVECWVSDGTEVAMSRFNRRSPTDE